jgi:uncharacterized protein with HEPN domain
MRSDQQRLLDIQEAIDRIGKYDRRGERFFRKNELIQTWVIHHLQILGEACCSMSETFKKQHPEMEWAKIRGMRNILVHGYFGIDLDIVWAVIEKDLPVLKTHIRRMLKN